MANVISREMLQAGDDLSTELLQVTEQHVITAIQSMVDDRERRAGYLVMESHSPHQLQQFFVPNQPPQQHCTATTSVTTSTAQVDSLHLEPGTVDEWTVERDEGVLDEVWTALMADKQRAVNEERLNVQIISSHHEQEQKHRYSEESESEEDQHEDDPHTRPARQRREQERLRHEHFRRQKEDAKARQEHEKKMQQKLREMGVCCQGFRWIKQSAGYRCAGGSHFIANAALEAMP